MSPEIPVKDNCYPTLERINSPQELKKLPKEQLPLLAEEIREFLIQQVTESGGHLASNLGVVELSLAIHRVFETPKDHVIFDVGHQSYVHKLLTGRREQFSTLRTGGGLSGFPKRCESPHDCFGTGHSSTSLSAALGFAESDKLAGSEAYTVCVLGDGAYTGGMIHEALNNCKKKLRLIIILNENEMSISKNIGRFAKELSKIRSSEKYFKTKNTTTTIIQKIPLIGAPLFSGLKHLKMLLKSALYGSNYFENLGLYYLGPVDGNDEEAVETLLREAKASKQSCIVHLKTKKGKGLLPAEKNPDRYHGIAPASKGTPAAENFSLHMGKSLTALAQRDERICAITAAMADGTGLVPFMKCHASRFFDVGIAEEHAVTFAAGLAANGYRPVVAIYSTFLQRAYDNILHDVALQELPVVFCIDRAGLNAADGATHHGIFDVAFLSQVPQMPIFTPITYEALERTLQKALQLGKPCAIRYPSGVEEREVVEAFYQAGNPTDSPLRTNFDCDKESLDGLIITDGRIVTEALAAAKELEQRGKHIGIVLLEQIKPYESIARAILPLLPEKACPVLFLEEEIRAGGMGMLLSDALSKHPQMQNKQIHILALDDQFGIPADNRPIWEALGLDKTAIVKALTQQ